jgi:hypothetical protein
VVDLLKRYTHVDDGDDARTIRAKVTGQLLTLDEALQDTIPPKVAYGSLLQERRRALHTRIVETLETLP